MDPNSPASGSRLVLGHKPTGREHLEVVGSEGLEPVGRRLSLWPGLSSSPASESRWDIPLGTEAQQPGGSRPAGTPVAHSGSLAEPHWSNPIANRGYPEILKQSGSRQCQALTHPKCYHIRTASRGTASSLPDVLPQPARPHDTHKQVTVILDSAPSTPLLSNSSGNQDLLGPTGSVGSTQ